jgi:hypothetical protein
VRITLDGVDKGVVDLFSRTAKWQQKLTWSSLPPGPHTLVLTPTGTKSPASKGASVIFDAFVVR